MRERSGEASRDSAPLASSSVRESKRTRLPSVRLARDLVRRESGTARVREESRLVRAGLLLERPEEEPEARDGV